MFNKLMDVSSPHNYYFSVPAFKRQHLASFFQKGLPSTSLLFPHLAKMKGLLKLTILENMQPTSSTKFHTLAFPGSLNWSKPPPSWCYRFLWLTGFSSHILPPQKLFFLQQVFLEAPLPTVSGEGILLRVVSPLKIPSSALSQCQPDFPWKAPPGFCST